MHSMGEPRKRTYLRVTLATTALLVVLAACGGGGNRENIRIAENSTTSVWSAHVVAAGGVPVQLDVELLARYRHDSESFTQGLVFDDQGNLFESAGRYGESSLRRVDVATGNVQQEARIDDDFFAEGLAYFDGRLIMLTWRESTAIVFDSVTFKEVARFSYEGEGWGLCYNGSEFVMSDGSADLVFRDAETFVERRRVTVTEAGKPVRLLNELECVGDRVYANQWQADRILEIDPRSGVVTAVVDASGLLDKEEKAESDVLNGIAFNPTTQTFLLTGKEWPWVFEARFIDASDHASQVDPQSGTEKPAESTDQGRTDDNSEIPN